MTLKEIREDYVRYSTNVSNLCRNLSYAGIGVVWIFKQTNAHSTQKLFMSMIPEELRWPLSFLIAALIIDLIQYIVQTGIWYTYYLSKRNEGSPMEEKDVVLCEPEVYNIIPWAFWIIKIVLVGIAYCQIGVFLL